MGIKQVGAPSGIDKEFIVTSASVAALPLSATAVSDGSWCHVIDAGIYGRFFADGGATGHWYDSATGAVIV